MAKHSKHTKRADGARVATLLTLTALVMSGACALDTSETLWSSSLPDLPLPVPLGLAVSSVENSQIATRFASAISRGAVFPELSSSFCAAAGLLCESNIRVSSYNLDNTHASRASSIKTINDFQFDFFLEENLVLGGEMHLSENLHDPIPTRAFLPGVVADALPSLTSANLPKLLQTFNIADTTPMATMMSTATYLCESPPLPGEDKDCPITAPAMVQFVATQLGSDQVMALATTGAPSETPCKPSPVKIESVTKRSLAEGDHIIICHSIMFPSALYYCHHVTGTKVVQALLRAHDDSIINAVGICHMDTRLWASEHPAFTSLHIPRGAEACHWSSQNDLVWVKAGTQ